MDDWVVVYSAVESNTKRDVYQRSLMNAIYTYFPFHTTQKSTVLPWLNQRILKLRNTQSFYPLSDDNGRNFLWMSRILPPLRSFDNAM